MRNTNVIHNDEYRDLRILTLTEVGHHYNHVIGIGFRVQGFLITGAGEIRVSAYCRVWISQR